jgi:hypothetical protein
MDKGKKKIDISVNEYEHDVENDKITDAETSAGAITNVLAGVVDALVPRALKALNRLIGSGVDIPVALLERHAENIRIKTSSYRAVETAIAEKAGALASSNPEIVERAMNNLLRKEYRCSENRESIVRGAVKLLKNQNEDINESTAENIQVDDDWLNVFERFAEDASTDRMQKLWSRVLAGEIRRPGAFSLRTLRFLSEFSQSDALIFADFCQNVVNDIAPKILIITDETKDIRHLMQLEAAGLITGASGVGSLQQTLHFDTNGHALLGEGNLALIFRGAPSTSFQFNAIVLTPLGKELMSLLSDRDVRAAMRNVALAVRSPQTTAAFIGYRVSASQTTFIDHLWLDN